MKHELDPIIVLLVPVLGLGRIFDVSSSSSKSSSPLEPSFGVFTDDTDFLASFGGESRQSDDCCPQLSETEAPKCVGDIVEVASLTASNAVEAILAAEGRRSMNQWLVVYVRGTTTALIFPPHGCVSLSRCGLTSCMEWLEECGITQLIVAVPSGDGGNTICRNLLFLGFSRIPKDVVTSRLPSWLSGYHLLVTDFLDV